MLDGVRVDYYGVPTPLARMATVSVPEPRLITIKPWEGNQITAVGDAVRDAGLGLTPQVEGDLVRVPLQPLTEQERKEAVASAREHAETARTAVRESLREGERTATALAEGGSLDETGADGLHTRLRDLAERGLRQVDAVTAAAEQDILAV
ncbi:ribosome-recycling factor [Saccharothrix syringae]|uniref:Ribosome-recycling factor n=1 Tax=Saccharothrix syringae TaxID=103733 RepID=A0A5Q0GX98_SACSY|nr:ribosome-recycling factor [Saccharothrix syringae]